MEKKTRYHQECDAPLPKLSRAMAAPRRRCSGGCRRLLARLPGGARVWFLLRQIRWQMLALGLGTLLATALVISLAGRGLNGPPTVDVLSEKLRHFEAHGDRYSVVLLGSSRFYRMIDTPLLDAEMRRHGCHETSFNFGVPAMFGVERDDVLARILARNPRLKLIVTEDVLATIGFGAEFNYLSDRQRHLYQRRYLGDALADIRSFPEGAMVMLTRIVKLAYGYLHEYSGIGKLSEGLLPQDAAFEESRYNPEVTERGGYVPIDAERHPWFTERRAAMANRSGEWPVRVAHRADAPAHPKAAARADYLAHRLERILDAGVGAALLILPQERPPSTTTAIASEIRGSFIDVPVLDYNSMVRFPQFFDEALWFDNYHPDHRGAAVITRQLAADLCSAITSKRH